MTSPGRVRLLAPCALAFLAALASGQKGTWGVRAEVGSTLARVEHWSDVARSREELLRLGPSAIPELFGCLVAGEVRRPAGEGLPLDQPRRAALIATIGSFPRPDVIGFLAKIARDSSSDREREEALQLLSRLGTRSDLKLALELGTPDDAESPISPELRQAFERSIAGIASRDPAALRALAAFIPRAHPSLQGSIALVLADGDAGEALSGLASALGSTSPAADALLLLEIGELGKRLTGTADLAALAQVRGYLGHPDAKLAVLACLALEKLGDDEAVPDLIALLDHRDPNVQREAHRALAQLTGLGLGAGSEDWLERLDAELAWWEERAENCRSALSSGSASEVAVAIQEICRHRLFPSRASELLTLGLERQETELVQLACRCLGSLRSRSAIPALLGALAHADPAVVETAGRALKKITGLSLPPLERAWRARLGLEE